jgi:tetratricopeptide (TPR) repeat protein
MKKSICLIIIFFILCSCNKGKLYNDGYTDKDTLQISKNLEKALQYAREGKTKKGFELSNSEMRRSRKIGWSKGVAYSYKIIGGNFLAEAKLDSAAVYFNKALIENKKFGYEEEVASNLANLGLLYSQLNLQEKSAATFDSAIAIFDKLGKQRKKFVTFTNASTTFYYLAEHDTTGKYYGLSKKNINQAIAFFKNNNDKNGYGRALFIRGNLYFLKGDYLQAWNCYHEAEENIDIKILDAYSSITLNKGLILLKCNDAILQSLSINPSDRLLISWEFLSKAEDSANSFEDKSTLMDISEAKAEWFEKKGDYHNALIEVKKTKAIRDEIASDEIKNSVFADFVITNEQISKDQLVKEKQDEDMEHIFTFLIALFLGIVFFLIAFSFANRHFNWTWATKFIDFLAKLGVTTVIEAAVFGVHFYLSENIHHNPEIILSILTLISFLFLSLHELSMKLLRMKKISAAKTINDVI